MFCSSACGHRSERGGSKLELERAEAADFQSRCYAAVALLTKLIVPSAP